MKSFAVLLFGLTVLVSNAQACPNLAGKYWCVINDGHRESWLDVLTIKQWLEPAEPGVTYFSSEYRSIPDGVDVFRADDQGIPNQWGWITKCTADRVVSVRMDYSAISEIYLDKDGSLVRADNLREALKCTPKTKL